MNKTTDKTAVLLRPKRRKIYVRAIKMARGRVGSVSSDQCNLDSEMFHWIGAKKLLCEVKQ